MIFLPLKQSRIIKGFDKNKAFQIGQCDEDILGTGILVVTLFSFSAISTWILFFVNLNRRGCWSRKKMEIVLVQIFTICNK